MQLVRALKSHAANASLLLGSLLLTLLVIEGVLRLFDLRLASYHPISGFCQYDEVLGWRLAPNRTGMFQGAGFSVLVEQSEQGLRDRFYPYARDAARRRILILGDSVVWCWGVEMSDCFTELVESRLPETDVIAAGAPGYGTAQELLLYERELSRFRPDLTLLLFVSNDPADNLAADNRPVFEQQDGELVLGNVPVPRRKGVAKQWLMTHSTLFRQLNHATQLLRHMIKMARDGTAVERPGDYVPIATNDRPEARSMTEALLTRLQQSVAADGGRLAIVNSGDAGEEVGEWLEAFSRPRGIPYLDLAPGLQRGRAEGRPMTLPSDPHYSVEAHAIVAEAILVFLRDEGLVNPATSR
ncbi:MAG TPA: SGNH/GDSL hydrolase family protein [Candidatus Polarisedimenticolia bacterium]|nr:SGNH/GDSL hydrolase family protein [Candidatus Polarisedimenticolia bacterium]